LLGVLRGHRVAIERHQRFVRLMPQQFLIHRVAQLRQRLAQLKVDRVPVRRRAVPLELNANVAGAIANTGGFGAQPRIGHHLLDVAQPIRPVAEIFAGQRAVIGVAAGAVAESARGICLIVTTVDIAIPGRRLLPTAALTPAGLAGLGRLLRLLLLIVRLLLRLLVRILRHSAQPTAAATQAAAWLPLLLRLSARLLRALARLIRTRLLLQSILRLLIARLLLPLALSLTLLITLPRLIRTRLLRSFLRLSVAGLLLLALSLLRLAGL
jgi:hypothetical protein